ncbi:MAG: cell wall hydrolase [Clostridiales bacterium]|nr:cell wall hydrolase [Clostridiales bacterium]
MQTKNKLIFFMIFGIALAAGTIAPKATCQAAITGSSQDIYSESDDPDVVSDYLNANPDAESEYIYTYSASELRDMACIIYCEARGEPYAGQVAVGIVVMNRKASSHWPNTIHEVIYQKMQFQPTRNGAMDKALAQYDAGATTSSTWRSCINAAKSSLMGQKKITYCGKTTNMSNYHFFATSVPGYRLKIGAHYFK